MLAFDDRKRRALALALPIIGGMVSQNVLNLVDTLMVGQLGNAALAAVGLGGFANFTCMALITGLSAGVQAMAARRLGEGKHGETALPLNGGLLISLCTGIPMSLLLVGYTPTIFGWLIDEPDVVTVGAPYLQARLCVLACVGMNFSYRGFWNAVNLSRVYFRTLLVMHALNILFNYLLIFGSFGFPQLGALGAGVASAIATALGSVAYSFQAWHLARGNGFLRKIPSRAALATMLRISGPASLQQLFLALGLTVFFILIGKVGTAELAASNVLVNLLLVAVLPGIGFGLAAASLVGQALGRNDVADARRWAWDVAGLCLVGVGLVTVPAGFFPDLLLGAFLQDEATLDMARAPMRLLAITLPFDAVGLVFVQALNGAGDTRRVLMIGAGLQWLVLLPIVYLVGPVLELGLFAIWFAQAAYRIVHMLVLIGVWRREQWALIKV